MKWFIAVVLPLALMSVWLITLGPTEGEEGLEPVLVAQRDELDVESVGAEWREALGGKALTHMGVAIFYNGENVGAGQDPPSYLVVAEVNKRVNDGDNMIAWDAALYRRAVQEVEGIAVARDVYLFVGVVGSKGEGSQVELTDA